jgi:hypothetical protein
MSNLIFRGLAKLVNLASETGADLIGFKEGGSSILLTVANKLRRTSSDTTLESTKPCYAAVAVNITRTTIDRHAFEDWSQLNTTDTNVGYCSFDAKAYLNNSLTQNHFVGYQSRLTYGGSGNLTNYFHGYNVALRHEGAGTIGNVTGLHITDISGAGPVTQNRGIYIDQIQRGATNHAIYSEAGNVHILGGPTGRVFTGVVQATALNFGVDTVSKAIAIGYGTEGISNFGAIKIYDGKTGVVATFDTTGLSVIGNFVASGAVIAGTVLKTSGYTVAGLPVGTEGQITYATNGRKVGQGATAGTGVPVYYSTGGWRVFGTDAVVLA